MRISVIGTGYLGATHAACLAGWGHEVVGVDRDEERLRRLAQGHAPFHEPLLEPMIREATEQGRLSFSADPQAVEDCEVHFLCVGTPQAGDGYGADLSALWAAADALAPYLGRDTLVVGKSTVPVGTARVLGQRMSAAAGRAVRLAWNPEFLREGHGVEDSLRPERLVFGVQSPLDTEVLTGVYGCLVADGVPVVVTDLETAELAKVSANLMLAARISLVNLLAEVCEAAGADVADLTTILGLDSRIGSQFLTPGVGYGGGCLPKDSRAFAARAAELGVPAAVDVVRSIDRVNRHQRTRTVDIAVAMVGGSVSQVPVAVLGAAFKGDSDDIRESPALDVARALRERGADVRVYDPQAGPNVARVHPELAVVGSVEAACRGAELVLVLTDWDEFRGLDPSRVVGLVSRARVVDGRQVLDAAKWRSAGWDLYTLGRGPVE